MPKFKKKPPVVEAVRWRKIGDDHDVVSFKSRGLSSESCPQCGNEYRAHGQLTVEDYHRVCPGDWIITDEKGKRYPCSPALFDATYEPAE